MVARVPLTIGHRAIVPGEVFSVTPVRAAALKYQRLALFAPAVPIEPLDAPVEPSPAPTRRQYRRRDLTAEPS